MQPHEIYETRLAQLIEEAGSFDIQSEDATNAIRNLEKFTKCRPPMPEPEVFPESVIPLTRWERFKAGTSAVWDNETTRVLIKAGGAFAGVGLVVYTTIHRDHVVEKQALAQSNQRNN